MQEKTGLVTICWNHFLHAFTSYKSFLGSILDADFELLLTGLLSELVGTMISNVLPSCLHGEPQRAETDLLSEDCRQRQLMYIAPSSFLVPTTFGSLLCCRLIFFPSSLHSCAVSPSKNTAYFR